MAARVRVWAEVLAEAGAAVAPDPVRGIPFDEAGRADLAVPVGRALRVAPPAGVDGASPWWLLETDVPQDDDGGVADAHREEEPPDVDTPVVGAQVPEHPRHLRRLDHLRVGPAR